MSISAISRNSLAAVIEVQDANGNVVVPAHVDIREGIDTSRLADLRQVAYTQGDTWGNVGYKLLGDARHWWAIAELSGVLNPFEELVAGLTLQTPSVNTLFLDILTGNIINSTKP